MSFGGGSSSAAHVNSAEEQKRQTLMEIRQLVWTDLDKAEKTISAIADPAIRSEALTYAAQAASHKNPEKSAVFAAEAEKAAAQVDNPIVRFQSACARLHSDAMNKDHEATVEGLEKTFQLADKVMRKTRDDGKETSFLIMPLVEAVNEAVKVEPELTVAHIESVYLAFEKAQLLTSAASALASAPRPIRSPAPNPDSQDKQAN
jgi:hypothetical protein